MYYVTHQQEVPYTHRKHAIFVSPQTEIALGLQTFQQVLHISRTVLRCYQSPVLGWPLRCPQPGKPAVFAGPGLALHCILPYLSIHTGKISEVIAHAAGEGTG